MTEWRVSWEIDIDAEGPMQAARRAWRIMHNRDSTATVFVVTSHEDQDYSWEIDLDYLPTVVCRPRKETAASQQGMTQPAPSSRDIAAAPLLP